MAEAQGFFYDIRAAVVITRQALETPVLVAVPLEDRRCD